MSYSLTVLSDLSFSKGVAPEQVKQILLSVDGMREFGPDHFQLVYADEEESDCPLPSGVIRVKAAVDVFLSYNDAGQVRSIELLTPGWLDSVKLGCAVAAYLAMELEWRVNDRQESYRLFPRDPWDAPEELALVPEEVVAKIVELWRAGADWEFDETPWPYDYLDNA